MQVPLYEKGLLKMAKDHVVSLCNRARTALAQARTLEDFKSVRDCGEAAIRLAKSRRDIGVEALFEAQEIVRRAERQLGRMLPAVTGGKGGDRKSSNTMLLDRLGIERMQSSRFQRIAQVPDEQFEEWICDCRAVGDELTQAAALRLAAECTADPIVRPAKEAHELIADALDAAVCKFIGRLTEKHQFAFVRMRMDRILATVKRMEADHGG
jgi:hypothetical protein